VTFYEQKSSETIMKRSETVMKRSETVMKRSETVMKRSETVMKRSETVRNFGPSGKLRNGQEGSGTVNGQGSWTV
jgi:hypothetical protein